jgi:hypothetical protein
MLEHLRVEALVADRDDDEVDPVVEPQPGGGAEAEAPPADEAAPADDLAVAHLHHLRRGLPPVRRVLGVPVEEGGEPGPPSEAVCLRGEGRLVMHGECNIVGAGP